MYLAERTILTEGIHKQVFAMADRNARLVKLLYNAALFRMRQAFTGWDKAARTENEKEVFRELDLLKKAYPGLATGRVLSYRALEKLMRVTDNPDFFSGLPMQTAQAVLKAAAGDFKTWLAARRAYKRDPSKFLGRPRMPGYCKSERKTFTITNQDAVLYPVYRDGEGTSGKGGRVYAGMELKLPGIRQRLKLVHLPEDALLKEVKVRPYYGKYVLALILEIKDQPENKDALDMPYMAGIDFGTDNIAAIVTTDRASRVYKGGAVLAKSRLFHKEKAKAVRILTKGKRYAHASSRHLDFISRKHDGFVRDAMHKVSADIVRFCREHRVGTIVIGANPLWKQRTDMGKTNNQNFTSVPHSLLRWMIMYKAGATGIRVIIQEESYTSKADVTSKDEIPVFGKPGSEKAVFSGKRIKRGLYRCADGSVVNADCNGAANILRKAIPDAWEKVSDFRFLAYPEAITYQGLNRCRAAG